MADKTPQKTTSKPKRRGTRVPYNRMLHIHQSIVEGRYPNCQKIAGNFEVSYKTIQRDIDFMRDQLLLPIEYDRTNHGFYYTQPVAAFPTVNMTTGEVVALLVAQKAIEQYRGTAFEKPLQAAFEKITGSLQDQGAFSLQDLSSTFSFRPVGPAEHEMRVFEQLSQAVVEQRVIEFDYHSLDRDKPERRRVSPYHLGCIDNQWYLIGHDHLRDALRNFALTRLTKPTILERQFERPKDFSVYELMRSSFSAFVAAKPERVVIRFDDLGARLASERQWHASQKLEPLPQGGALLEMEVGVAPDLIKWILGWGSHAQVLEPAALRERVADEARRMALQYS